ncbi:hypothetical protein LZ31DRAFT_624889 [Colletotrichum somersetense]|nr:hypothetical protein LZ31DRAFT_624889 [Colletotrichum somersetense]
MAMKAGMFSYKLNAALLLLLSSAEIHELYKDLRNKAHVHRDMDGRIDCLDNTVTLGERREKMMRIHNTIQQDKYFQDILMKQKALRDFLVACIQVEDLIWVCWNSPGTTKEQKWARSEKQRNKALKRDKYRCVLTNSAIGEVCHIVPFWTLSQRAAIQLVIGRLGAVLGDDFSDRLMRPMNQQTGRGTTEHGDLDLLDSPANMITLSTQLHKMWDDGVFGLEPIGRPQKCNTAEPLVSQMKLGIEQQTKYASEKRLMYGIKIRFHWLQKTNMGGFKDSPPTLDADPRSMWKAWDHNNDKERLPNWDLLSVQWLAFRLHRLSGAADVDLYAPLMDQEDDDALAARVIQAKRQATVTIAKRLGLDDSTALCG